ncbi:hypothetical protein [Streptomyces sp. NPDC047024]|uniref:hypothetical protein n=1 Tax=Streptomyces sp. NPDC047024 TaxID=3155476 RepID=UPI0033EA431C
MHARRAACAALLTLAVATTGCGSGKDSGPVRPPGFPGATPNASAAAARVACVDAWAELLLAHPRHWSPKEDPTPEECAGQSGDTAIELEYQGSMKAEEERARRAAASPIDDGASLTASETGRP